MAKKYLIDASIIASSLEDFKRRFLETDCTLVLSDLTLRELEPRKKAADCEYQSRSFARFIIDLFVRDTSTEICLIDYESNNKHIDETLVKYAGRNNLSILTSDKGMALWCRFYGVSCELLEVRSTATLPFVCEKNGTTFVNIFNGSIPKDSSVYVYSPEQNRIISPLDNGIIFLNHGYIVLVAHPENSACGIDTYYVDSDKKLSLIGKDIYSSETDIATEEKPFHKNLFLKWTKYMSK